MKTAELNKRIHEDIEMNYLMTTKLNLMSLEKFILYLDETEQHIDWLFKIGFISIEEHSELIESVLWTYEIIKGRRVWLK